jgi:signal transduction histidine kinase
MIAALLGDLMHARIGNRLVAPTLQRMLLPTVLLLTVAVLVLSLVLFDAVRRLDQTAAEAARRAVDGAIEHEVWRVGLLAYDYSWLEEAYALLVVDPDPDWADSNIGGYLAAAFEMDASFVASPENATTFAFLEGEASEATLESVHGPEIWDLIERAREAPHDEPVPVSAFVQTHGEVHLVVASAITSEKAWLSPDSGEIRGVLVLSLHFPNDHFAGLLASQNIKDLGVDAGPVTEKSGAIPLPGLDGEPVAHVIWTAETPGSDLMRQLAVPLVLALLTAAGTIFIAFRNASAIVAHEDRLQTLLEREQEFRAVRDRFLVMSSHRLRTPLAVIQAAAELIAGYRDRMSDAELGREAQAIIQSVQELDALIGATIQLARDRDGTGVSHAETVALETLVSEIWARREDPPALVLKGSATVRGDIVQLNTILAPVLDNAAKFSQGRQPVSVEIESDERGVVVRVRDHGIGIAKDDLPKLGTPFLRGQNAETFSGSGIGLAVATYALNQIGGSLEFESGLRDGTTATITLRSVESDGHAVAGEPRS